MSRSPSIASRLYVVHSVSIAEECLSCVHRFIFSLIRYRFRDISTFIIGADIAAGHAAEVWMSVSSLLSLVSVFALHCIVHQGLQHDKQGTSQI